MLGQQFLGITEKEFEFSLLVQITQQKGFIPFIYLLYTILQAADVSAIVLSCMLCVCYLKDLTISTKQQITVESSLAATRIFSANAFPV